MKRVVVGLSGGVDSSVAAYLLLQEGYDVIGVFMKNWHDASVIEDDDCPWIDDSNDALLVAEHLGIPFQVIDLSGPYKERIVDYMFAEYEAGRTPNPDVLCNREIKFSEFLEVALQMGADYVATGHYVQKESIEVNGVTRYRLLAGNDPNKDQSYFLCQVNQDQLSRALFPIGHLKKSRVREIAEESGLPTAQKKDSQGLCFVGKISLPDFLQQQLAAKEGNVILVSDDHPMYRETGRAPEAPFVYKTSDGKVVGQHRGAHFFTIGQRKGLGIGGFKLPLFVIGTDVDENVIYVGEGEDHPGLLRKALRIEKDALHWVRPDLRLDEGGSLEVMARIRYRQPLQPGTITMKNDHLILSFEEPQKSITPGQFAAWYLDAELIGSGVIS